jgi:spore coat protein U-like protein
MNKNIVKKAFGLIGAGAVLVAVAAPDASALTSSTTFGVSAIVGESCLVSTPFSAINVAYVNGGPAVTSTSASTATVTCAGLPAAETANWNLTTTNNFIMKPTLLPSNPYSLTYGFCVDAVCTGGSFTTANAAMPLANGAQNFSLFLNIPAGQPVLADTYTDTVTATLTY